MSTKNSYDNNENELQMFVPNVHYELIPIKNLVSNQEYQRKLSVKHVKKAAENFDIYQINPVKVSRRDGINYVFNGQHTIEIVASVSESRETPVWCMIYDDLEYTQEADIFANQLKYTKSLTPYEIFMANIEAGNDKQLIIKSLVESYDLVICGSKQTGGICAVSTLEKIHDTYGYHVLDRTLRLTIGTWEGDQLSFGGSMLHGIAKLIACYGDDLNDEIFKEKLGRISTKEIVRTAKDRKAGPLGFAEAMLLIYNKKMQRPLPFERLYTRKGAASQLYDEENSDSQDDDLDMQLENDSDSIQEDNELSLPIIEQEETIPVAQ